MLDVTFEFIQNHAWLLAAMAGISVVSAVLTLTIGVRLVARLPSDYFINPEQRQNQLAGYPQVVRVGLPLLKNIVGLVFVIAGVAMLVLPGQGILTLLAGILIMNFPGKYALERWLLRQHRIRETVNWIRHRSGQPPLRLDPDQP